jgi:hypothetical protein
LNREGCVLAPPVNGVLNREDCVLAPPVNVNGVLNREDCVLAPPVNDEDPLAVNVFPKNDFCGVDPPKIDGFRDESVLLPLMSDPTIVKGVCVLFQLMLIFLFLFKYLYI